MTTLPHPPVESHRLLTASRQLRHVSTTNLPRLPGFLPSFDDGFSADAVTRLKAGMAHRELLEPAKPAQLLRIGIASGLEGFRLKAGGSAWLLEAGSIELLQQGLNLLWRLKSTGSVPDGFELEDHPAFPWRGLMLDCARRWWPAELLHRVLDQVAFSGGNRLHLHLTDDQGWRLPSAAKNVPRQAHNLRAGERGPGTYSARELCDLVRHGRELGIELLPEVDLPGHSMALLAARPDLSCDGRERELPHAWGGYSSPFCLGSRRLEGFVDELLEQLCSIFPFPVIHLGGDEVREDSWKECPRCIQLATSAHLGGPEELQSWWTPWIARRLASAGRRPAFWDEARSTGAPSESLLFAWRGGEAVRQAVADGFETVACPIRPCYLDHYPGEEASQPRAIMGLNRWQDALEWTPGPAGGSLLGGQANLWSEYINSEALLMERLQPRLSLLLDRCWQPEHAAGELKARLPLLLNGMRTGGWRARIDPPRVTGSRVAAPGAEIELLVEPAHAGVQVSTDLETGTEDIRLRREPVGDGQHVLVQPTAELVTRRGLLLRSSLGEHEGSLARLELRWMNAMRPPGTIRNGTWLLRAGSPDWRDVRSSALGTGQWPGGMEDFLALCAESLDDRTWSEVALEADTPPTPPLPRISPWPRPFGLRRTTSLELDRHAGVTCRLSSMGLARLWLDGELVLDHDGFQPDDASSCDLLLEPGRHQVLVEWLRFRREGGAGASLVAGNHTLNLTLPGVVESGRKQGGM